MAETFAIRAPFPAAPDGAMQFDLVGDYGSQGSQSDLAKETSVRVTIAANDATLRGLQPIFPGYVSFRMTNDTLEHPTGDLVLETTVLSSQPFIRELRAGLDLPPVFFVYGGITLDRASWLAAGADTFHDVLAALTARNRPTNYAIDNRLLTDFSAKSLDQIFDYFLQGRLRLDIPAAAPKRFPLEFDGPTFNVRLLMGRLERASDSDQRAQSVRELIRWGQQPSNRSRSLVENAMFSPIPIGYFFSHAPASYFASQDEAAHPFISALLKSGAGFDRDAWTSLFQWLGVSRPRWRRVVLTTEYAPRVPVVWRQWTTLSTVIDGVAQTNSVRGETYWLLPDGERTLRARTSAGLGKKIRKVLTGADFGDSLTTQFVDREVKLVVKCDQPTYLVTNMHHSTQQYADHETPLDLGPVGAENSGLFKVEAQLSGDSIFRICSGETDSHSVHHVKDAYWGLVEVGTLKPEPAILARSDLGWTESQASVLAAVSNNEGCLDAINTLDTAFLSFGMLQWAAYTPEKCGELAAFIKFLKVRYPASYREYFGRLGVDEVDTDEYPADAIPRGILKISGLELRENVDKNDGRKYLWSLVFRIAAQNSEIQTAELQFAYERLKIVRDRQIQLPSGNRTIGSLFTSEYSAALIFDHHTNHPSTVESELKKYAGSRPPDADGSFTTAQLDEIMALYGPVRKDMWDPGGRKDRIDQANLNHEAKSFIWPDGIPNGWMT